MLNGTTIWAALSGKGWSKEESNQEILMRKSLSKGFTMEYVFPKAVKIPSARIYSGDTCVAAFELPETVYLSIADYIKECIEEHVEAPDRVLLEIVSELCGVQSLITESYKVLEQLEAKFNYNMARREGDKYVVRIDFVCDGNAEEQFIEGISAKLRDVGISVELLDSKGLSVNNCSCFEITMEKSHEDAVRSVFVEAAPGVNGVWSQRPVGHYYVLTKVCGDITIKQELLLIPSTKIKLSDIRMKLYQGSVDPLIKLSLTEGENFISDYETGLPIATVLSQEIVGNTAGKVRLS